MDYRKKIETAKTFPSEFRFCDLAELTERHRRIITNWIDDPEAWCLFIQGTVGAGKTHAAYATIKEFQGKHIAMTALDLVSNLQSDYETHTEDNFKKLRDVELLLIDDLGAEKNNEDSLFQVSRILLSRHLDNKKTIITTNEKINVLAARYHPRITSRIMAGTAISFFDQTDRRV